MNPDNDPIAPNRAPTPPDHPGTLGLPPEGVANLPEVLADKQGPLVSLLSVDPPQPASSSPTLPVSARKSLPADDAPGALQKAPYRCRLSEPSCRRRTWGLA